MTTRLLALMRSCLTLEIITSQSGSLHSITTLLAPIRQSARLHSRRIQLAAHPAGAEPRRSAQIPPWVVPHSLAIPPAARTRPLVFRRSPRSPTKARVRPSDLKPLQVPL